MASTDLTPESMAKKFFLITVVGVFVYIGLVVFVLSAPNKAPTDRVDQGVVRTQGS